MPAAPITDPTQRMQTQQELLIQVDAHNSVIGSVGKIEAHRGKGLLHRAFTAFLFDEKGRILLTQRSDSKPLWPGYWDAACSSHQWFPEETAAAAANRRIPFELGIELPQPSNLQELFSSEYHAVYSSEWSENEINSIVVGTYTGECKLNPKEVREYRWLTRVEVSDQLNSVPSNFAPWFPIAWEGLRERGIIS